MQWLRRSFIAGFFVTVPLFISVAAFLWLFRLVDGLVGPLYVKFLGREVPGLGIATTALAVLLVGAIATNVVGKRVLQQGEALLMRVPLFRSIYAPVKQLVVAFSPDNEYGFKRVVLIEDATGGLVLGFLTKEFSVDRGQGPQALIAVYVPTNHLYLGDIYIYPRDRVSFPDVTVEQGIRIFLTGGMALASRLRARRGDALRPLGEDGGGDGLGVAALHLGHASLHGVAGQAAAHEDDEAVVARHTVAAVGKGVDGELELLVSLDGCGHGSQASAVRA